MSDGLMMHGTYKQWGRGGAARSGGFTLIELMVVVIILGVLAAIAVPIYTRYAYRARRADGQELLMRIAQAQERYYTSYNAYTTDLDDLGYTGGTATSENGYYTASLSLPTGASAGAAYLAEVTPQKAQAKDVCGKLGIDDAGRKTPDASDTDANSNGSCW